MDTQISEKLTQAREAVMVVLQAVAGSRAEAWVPGVRGQVAKMIAEALAILDDACGVAGVADEDDV